MLQNNAAKIRLISAAIGLSLLAGCVTPPPPPPPPPAPVVKYIPPRPTPPGGAVATMFVPPRDTYGVRQTVNYGLSNSQTVWNFRSALNVAALNCQGERYAPLIPAYRSILEGNKRELVLINDRIVAEFKAEHGSNYRDAFDGYMTKVYNYFALPPAQSQFCETALQVSNDYMVAPSGGLEGFALTNMGRLESVFENFFTSLEQYRAAVAAWDAEHAPSSDATSSVASPSGEAGAVPATTPGVSDPVMPVFISDPVVEAVSGEAPDE